MKSILCTVLALLIVLPAYSTNPGNEKSLLWKIEGDGIKTSYLYGTFHLINQSDFDLKEKVIDAFGMTDQLVLEMDMDDPTLQQKVMQHSMMKDGGSIKQLLTEEEYLKVDSMLKAEVGMGLVAVDKVKPFIVLSMMLPAIMEEQTASYEAAFMQLAAQQEKETHGLETAEFQLGVFDKIPYDSQADDLVELVEETDEMRNIMNEMIALYKVEDIDGLYAMFNEYYDDQTEIELLLDNRNKTWVETIPEMAAESASFFAVGAGHLAGDNGMINLLRKAGYTVTPIE